MGNSVDSSVGNGVDSSVGSSVTLNKHKQKHKKTSSRNRKKRTYDENSDYMKLAKFLQKQILINKPDFKEPVIQAWADDMRKLVELDKRDKHDVALVIKWCQQDSFWSTNILSASKLRKQFDQLYLKMQASKGSSPEPRASKHDDQIKQARREREKFVLYKYSEVGNDLDKALPMIQAKYPEIDSKDKALRILYPERYMTAGGVENGDICAVLVDGENATLKRFKETSKAVILEPESFNPIYKPLIFPKNIDQDFRILGKYVFATSLLK